MVLFLVACPTRVGPCCLPTCPTHTCATLAQAAVSVHKCVPLFFLSRQACVRTGQVRACVRSVAVSPCGRLGVWTGSPPSLHALTTCLHAHTHERWGGGAVGGQCFVLNGVLFLGSVLLANAVVLPLIHWYRDFLGVDPVCVRRSLCTQALADTSRVHALPCRAGHTHSWCTWWTRWRRACSRCGAMAAVARGRRRQQGRCDPTCLASARRCSGLRPCTSSALC